MKLNAGSNFISNYQVPQELPTAGIKYFDSNVVWHLVAMLISGKILGTVCSLWSRNTGVRNPWFCMKSDWGGDGGWAPSRESGPKAGLTSEAPQGGGPKGMRSLKDKGWGEGVGEESEEEHTGAVLDRYGCLWFFSFNLWELKNCQRK